MHDIVTFATVRDEISHLVRSGHAGLVVGAGASVSSGAPLTADLVNRIRSEFPKASHSPNSDLFSVCDSVVHHRLYGASDLHRFVRCQFDTLSPSNDYKQLPRIPWRVLFTTNYDDLIEQTYTTPGRVQSLQVRHLGAGAATVPREGHLLLFYLMGSIRGDLRSGSSPILTWDDFLETEPHRRPVLDLFKSLLLEGGKIIYVGYSFTDFVLARVLERAIREIGVRNQPHGYAILYDEPDNHSPMYQKLMSLKVQPVHGTFEDLCDVVRHIADAGDESRHTPTPARGRTLTLSSGDVTLTDRVASVIEESFTILSNELTEERTGDQQAGRDQVIAFLDGRDVGWLPYRRNWGFRRPALEGVFHYVSEKSATRDPASNQVVLVHGPAGLGKSVMARQLAFALYRETGLPVLFAKKNWTARPDVKLINRFCIEVEDRLDDIRDLPTVIVIVDEAELLDRGLPFRATRFLRGQGRPVLFVLFARTNEYFRTHLSESGEPKYQPHHDIEVSERLTKDEITALIEHLNGLGIWATPRITTQTFWADYVEQHFDKSFFDTVYTLVEPTRPRLSERVWTEYEHLSDIGKESYRLTAAVHQFGISMKMELLMRLIDADFPTFDGEVVRGDAQSVLVTEHLSNDLNLFLRGRTKVISKIVFDRALPSTADQLSVFKQIVSAAEPSAMFGSSEIDSIRTLLVQVLGPKGFDNRFSWDEQAELYLAATEKLDDDVLEHHFGLVEINAHRLLSARTHLERSLRLNAELPSDLAIQRESPQNVENSLALVLGKLAATAAQRGSVTQAHTLYEEARQHFINARLGQFPNAAAYDAHTRMLRSRAELMFKNDEQGRTYALGEALEIVTEGIETVNNDDQPQLMELRGELLEALGRQRDAIAELARKAGTGPATDRARYYTILAQLYASRRPTKRKHWRRAFEHAVKATQLNPKYFPAWRLRAQSQSEINPRDRELLMQTLRSALKLPEANHNLWLLFRAAVTAFLLDSFDESSRIFGRLRRASGGHEKRFGVLEYADDAETRELLEYDGYIVQSTRPGRFSIRSSELSAFNLVWFNNRSQPAYTPRIGDHVSFAVGFNYRGISGVDLRRN